jgi:hypothetical protein
VDFNVKEGQNIRTKICGKYGKITSPEIRNMYNKSCQNNVQISLSYYTPGKTLWVPAAKGSQNF